ncbi:DUF72 domain-containing protein [Marinobacter salarius]|jgi:uncharacterized protein YecE (DUF72 family)|uniref:DUF72 domain-containing protein n=1 Tax=Marinobacter salarius TaxID=1420917 RepID=UPI0022AF0891|nr:DUF72 domain-containing protein [Marinobacter salarius]MCZ4283317.1 DUF72 domain-containing protein [Marinobacter salarius]
MAQPYFLGCPQWQHPDWTSRLPPGQSPLARYSSALNCVEGNTTFYATPSQEQCRQWRSQVPDDFRFLLKFPRLITHDRLLSGAGREASDFLEIIAPLNDVLGPILLQLPASFGPERLENLWRFMDALPPTLTCTVEVRHSAFFDKGEAEKALNRGLRERRIARVCMDSRALFAATPDNEETRDAQRKKPRVPVHLLPVDAAPVIRFVGHPDLEANRPFLAPWVERAAAWIEEGKRPYIFMHMPNKGDALSLAALWNELLRERAPTVDALDLDETQPQMGLF